MSDSSTQSRRSGSGGPRRSGNRRRRNNNNRNRNRGGGGEGGDQRKQGRRSGPNSGRRPPREPKPIPLTWWQKILKAVGLYKEPVRPPRKRKDPAETPTKKARKAPKSGTRVAKTAEGKREAAPPKPVDSTRLYLGNLSYDASEYDLEDLFKGVGAVRNVEIVYNRNTHKSKGYGFIEMATIDEAKRAVEVLHDQPFMGRKMIVNGAKSKGTDDREDKGGQGDSD